MSPTGMQELPDRSSLVSPTDRTELLHRSLALPTGTQVRIQRSLLPTVEQVQLRKSLALQLDTLGPLHRSLPTDELAPLRKKALPDTLESRQFDVPEPLFDGPEPSLFGTMALLGKLALSQAGKPE